MLEHAIHSMINSYRFTFKDYVFKPSLTVDKINMSLFKKHEILKGRTISDLFADNLTVIQKALEYEDYVIKNTKNH